MDLQNFSAEMLYFQEDSSSEVESLLLQAANNYGKESEAILMQALSLSPNNISVLVGLYRFYYYQHRYEDALNIAGIVMDVVGSKIKFPKNWNQIQSNDVVTAVGFSFTLVRLYFFALKAAGYVCLRLNRFEEGRAMLEKVVAMDSEDRIGAQLLLDVLGNNCADVLPFNKFKQRVEA